LVDTREIQPPEAKMPRLFRQASVRFGRPITVDRYLDRASDKLVLRQLTDEVMYEIRGLTGQEYVDTYATKKSETLPGRTAVVRLDAEPGSEGGSNGHGNGEPRRRSSADLLSGVRAG
jgi:1-acyl-sn-glycerol-3-phosphate acyltransferase